MRLFGRLKNLVPPIEARLDQDRHQPHPDRDQHDQHEQREAGGDELPLREPPEGRPSGGQVFGVAARNRC